MNCTRCETRSTTSEAVVRMWRYSGTMCDTVWQGEPLCRECMTIELLDLPARTKIVVESTKEATTEQLVAELTRWLKTLNKPGETRLKPGETRLQFKDDLNDLRNRLMS